MEVGVKSQPLVDQPLEFATARSPCSRILHDEIAQEAADTEAVRPARAADVVSDRVQGKGR